MTHINEGKYIQENYNHSITQYEDALYNSDMYRDEIGNYNPSNRESGEEHTGENNGRASTTYKTASTLPRCKVADMPEVIRNHLESFYNVNSETLRYRNTFEDFNISFPIKHEESNIKDIMKTIISTVTDNMYSSKKIISTTTLYPFWFLYLTALEYKIEGTNLIHKMFNINGKEVTNTVSCRKVIDEFNKYIIDDRYKIKEEPSAHGGEFQVELTTDVMLKYQYYTEFSNKMKTCQNESNAGSYARGYADFYTNPTIGIGVIRNGSGQIEGRFVFRIMYDCEDVGGDASKFDNMYIVLDRIYARGKFADKLTHYSWQIPYYIMKTFGYKCAHGGRFVHGAGGQDDAGTTVSAHSWSALIDKTNLVTSSNGNRALRGPARATILTTHSYYQDTEGCSVYLDPERKMKVDFLSKNHVNIFNLS